jgi:2-polyprenyl-6-methoxyphenol hydroxylase-like FAD-dependent oxidoreductase
MNVFDVVVVGARPAGAAVALLLARAGVSVALVDRSAYGSDTVSTHGLMRAGVLQLSRWGLLDRVVAAGTPPIRATTFHYLPDETVRVSIRPYGGVDALYAPRRTVLDRLLVDAAVEAGAEALFRSAATGVVRDRGDRVTGVRIRPAGRSAEDVLRARVVVGADGIRSLVANHVSARVTHRGAAATAFLYRYVADLPVDGYEWAYGRRAAAGLIPTNHDETCVFVGTTPTELHALRGSGSDQAFATLLDRAAPSLAERVARGKPVGRLHGWAGMPAQVRRAWGPGWALVGDAGYYRDPITTHGITDALRDAELLSDELVATLAGTVPEPVALARYEGTRDRVSERLLAATEAVATYRWTIPEVQAHLRRVSSAMSDEMDLLQARAEGDSGVTSAAAASLFRS